MNRKPQFHKADSRYYFEGELGAVYSEAGTEFRVWAPFAEAAVLRLYESAGSPQPYYTCKMRKRRGVWSASVPGDLHGVFYTYEITYAGRSAETIDIYARAAGANGLRGMVCDLSRTDPPGWEGSSPVRLEAYTDAVIYELHIRDFSSDESGGFRQRGKYGAFCEENPVNGFGERIGLDHIAGLGVTHIHLLPVFDFQSSDEASETPAYNWGYDPLNYNLPEGSYSADPDNGALRIRELKELILAAHRRGLGIIMDVVYNHMFSAENSPFDRTFPGYYYRHNLDGSLSNGSGCGNEFAGERAMAGKFICDSLCFWAEEYKIDGFRFDLMGLLDIPTLNRCAARLKAINPSIILYGEGWTGGCSPLPESLRGMKRNAVKLPDFAMFSDDFRDGVKGSVFSDSDCGYVNGGCADRTELIKSVISAGIYRSDTDRPEEYCWTDNPQQVINYVECHDNLTLYDKLTLSMPDYTPEEIEAADRLAAALVFLSQGIPFIQAGQEFLRSKGLEHNSYNLPDSVNGIKWNGVTQHRETLEYYRGLIAIRGRFPQLRMRTAGEIRGKIRYEDLGGCCAAVHIDGLLLLLNPTREPLSYLIRQKAPVYADNLRASPQPLYYAEGRLSVSPLSAMLLGER